MTSPLDVLRGPSVSWTHRPGRGDELRTLGDAIWDGTPWATPRLRWPRCHEDPDRAGAHLALTAALQRAEADGRRVPCRTGGAGWLEEDDTADARAAATACAACPVLEQCRRYVLAHPERVGVWGGLTVRARRRRAAP